MLHTATSAGVMGVHWQMLALKHSHYQLQGHNDMKAVVCWKLPVGISSQ